MTNNILKIEKVFGLFFLFFIGTSTFIILLGLSLLQIKIGAVLLFILFVVGVLSYEYIFIESIKYYSNVWKIKILQDYVKNKKRYYWGTIILFGLTYSIIDAINAGAVLIFFRDAALITIMVLIGPKIIEKFKK